LARALADNAPMTRDHGHHDMGGEPAGPVDQAEHHYALWEKRVDALLVLLSDKKRRIIGVDELRRGIESLPADAYERMSYYERWIASITANLVEKGVLDQDEIDSRVADLRARDKARP